MKRLHLFVCLIFLTLSCFVSIALGKDVNWDLLNYHFYTPYALLTGRLGFDVLPSQTQTFLNPLADIPTYLMITSLKPIVIGGIMGVVHGLNLVLVYFLTIRVFRSLPMRTAATIGVTVTAISATGSIFLGLLGTFMGDLTMSIFVLAAVNALVQADTPSIRARTRALILAGLFVGIGTGFKTTALFHAIPLVCLSLVFGSGLAERFRSFVICAVAFATGFLLIDGYWALTLQQHFDSPFFPYYNGLFQSPYALPHNLTDFLHWKPETLGQHIKLPFSFLMPGGGLTQSEVYFRDWRPGIAFIALVLFGFSVVWRWTVRGRIRTSTWPEAKLTVVLSLFFVISWVIWQLEFSYYRYLAGLELLVPLVVASIAYFIVPRVHVLGLTLVTMYFLLAPTTIPMRYDRTAWSDDYFEVRIPDTLALDGVQIYFADLDSPLGYLVPFFPASAQVLRLRSNMEPLLKGADGVHSLLVSQLLKQAQLPRPKYVMFLNQLSRLDTTMDDVRARINTTLHEYGLQLISEGCEEITSVMHRVMVCPVGMAVG